MVGSCFQSGLSATYEKMNVLKKLNQSETGKPYHGLPFLALGYHEIVHFRSSNGKYGKGVIAELKREIVFLPQYLVQKLDAKDIEELNGCEEPLYLYFGGRHEKNK